MLNLLFLIAGISSSIKSLRAWKHFYLCVFGVASLFAFYLTYGYEGYSLTWGSVVNVSMPPNSYSLYFSVVVILSLGFFKFKTKQAAGIAILAPIVVQNASLLLLGLVLILAEALDRNYRSILRALFSLIFGILFFSETGTIASINVYAYFGAFCLSVLALFINNSSSLKSSSGSAMFNALLIPVLIVKLAQALAFSSTPIIILGCILLCIICINTFKQSLSVSLSLASLLSLAFLSRNYDHFLVLIAAVGTMLPWLGERVVLANYLKALPFLAVRVVLGLIIYILLRVMFIWDITLFSLSILLLFLLSGTINKSIFNFAKSIEGRSLTAIVGFIFVCLTVGVRSLF
ncbi:MAG: hypothetical protein CME64_14895 [Halobacteriovoraceae bacterium]|nr:hypothetical protein [Halobacteriovoraceae bacterium]|tara:strand:+ start:24130 stop:25170 length:1041 start_codon:yes stop_codon:yes gene_type:complete